MSYVRRTGVEAQRSHGAEHGFTLLRLCPSHTHVFVGSLGEPRAHEVHRGGRAAGGQGREGGARHLLAEVRCSFVLHRVLCQLRPRGKRAVSANTGRHATFCHSAHSLDRWDYHLQSVQLLSYRKVVVAGQGATCSLDFSSRRNLIGCDPRSEQPACLCMLAGSFAIPILDRVSHRNQQHAPIYQPCVA